MNRLSEPKRCCKIKILRNERGRIIYNIVPENNKNMRYEILCAAILLLATLCLASPEYETDYMRRPTSHIPYPYQTECDGSFWHCEGKIWANAMTLVFEVYIPNTVRFFTAIAIWGVIWTIGYWVCYGLQIAMQKCFRTARAKSRAAAYVRLCFITFSIGWWLLGGVAALSIATWDASLLLGFFPISSLVFAAFFSGAAYNLAGGVSMLYAGIVEVGLVLSFQANTGMMIQGVVLEVSYLYTYIITEMHVKKLDGSVDVRPIAPGGSMPSNKVKKRAPGSKNMMEKAMTHAGLRAAMGGSSFDASLYLEDVEEDDTVIVWLQQIPNSLMLNHPITFPYAEPGVRILHPVWATRWTSVAAHPGEATCEHVNNHETLKKMTLTSSTGARLMEKHTKSIRRRKKHCA